MKAKVKVKVKLAAAIRTNQNRLVVDSAAIARWPGKSRATLH
jgi:hypothetical protein